MLSIAIQTLEGTYPPKDEDKEEETRSTKSIKIEKVSAVLPAEDLPEGYGLNKQV